MAVPTEVGVIESPATDPTHDRVGDHPRSTAVRAQVFPTLASRCSRASRSSATSSSGTAAEEAS
jgi:hypothetical protein